MSFKKQLSVVALGCGGGVPQRLPPGMDPDYEPLPGNTNFALVHHKRGARYTPIGLLQENPFWLVDCGPETIHHLTEWGCFPQLQGVILTHVHVDHSGGLASLAYRMMFVERRKIPLYFHRGLETLLRQQLVELNYLNTIILAEKGSSSIETVFTTPNPSDIWEETPEGWPFSVHLFPVSHNIEGFPCFGVEVNAEDGTRYVFSGDTASPLHHSHIDNATLVFHDVQTYNPGDGTEVHCPYPKLKEAIPLKQRDKVVLCHTFPEERFQKDGFRHARRWDVFSGA